MIELWSGMGTGVFCSRSYTTSCIKGAWEGAGVSDIGGLAVHKKNETGTVPVSHTELMAGGSTRPPKSNVLSWSRVGMSQLSIYSNTRKTE